MQERMGGEREGRSGVLCTDAILDRLLACSPEIACAVERTRLDRHRFQSWTLRDVLRLERLGVVQRIPLPDPAAAGAPAEGAGGGGLARVRRTLLTLLWRKLAPYVRLLLLITIARDRIRILPRLLLLFLAMQMLAGLHPPPTIKSRL